jgi:hypothetical protein
MSQPTPFPGDPSAWTVVTPPWPPVPDPAAAAPPASAVAPRRKGMLLAAALAILGVLAGAVGTAFLVTAAFLSAAEDIGRGISEGITRSIDGAGPQLLPGAGGPVEQFPAVAPGDLGPDPVLDAYARSCFDGDLQACDDLWYESPPMSDYETYAGTCGGRVKQDAVPACTDLD